MTPDVAFARLVESASVPYRAAGPYAYHFARGKLRGDPSFQRVLELGLLQGRSRILDLGCGQGLLASWLLAAHAQYSAGDWPSAWPAAPRPQALLGIDLLSRDIQRAQVALGSAAYFTEGDIRDAAFTASDAIVILDVLHYIDLPAQQRVLERVRAALPDDGLLLLRVGDAEAGLRARISVCVDFCLGFLRSGVAQRLHRRSLRDWQSLLAATGFHCKPVPMSSAAQFADVLFSCRPA
ncbi:MAG: class I SAM-dependent methyltransferase [Pseudomonadota bacterium]